ncbi:TlpA family protein disulfide reductase [Flavobacterium sp. CYK-55]|uniref:TlpA family protein disulfide reductase n=1 Tax=Flavobacterium sp. CYK-55 TaxID=2835529 RepID=UPI001BCFCD9F|nr:TlpA disulfide reductase family protein [Flavobacterium sp. CYK-55]MBS7788141.1 TlpA family protein disulfide reductase [Flavobacterium sp. CYK-55]
MKNVLTCLLMVVVTAACTQAQSEFSKTALKETLLHSEGEQTAFKEVLKKHKGKTLVIECWASWCSDCVKAMPKVKELQANHPEVEYVFISMDKTPEKWKLGIEKHELIGDHYLANDGMKGVFGSAINLDWIPRYIVVDKKGKIVLYRAIETDFETIDKTLNSLK